MESNNSRRQTFKFSYWESTSHRRFAAYRVEIRSRLQQNAGCLFHLLVGVGWDRFRQEAKINKLCTHVRAQGCFFGEDEQYFSICRSDPEEHLQMP